MNDNARQQIVEKIKDSSNILVTVSRDPSVDALSAALGLTVLLNKMKKHATAVFSGAVPPAITFLEPTKTFEATVDSLRDFIIALDKEKADHLRYKVDGDVVKIFITPYRTTITSEDLDFSQGDYNVELVLALGVHSQDDLDEALSAHGRILHDATVATISIGDTKSELGSIDWRSENASSLSEMLVSLSDALGAGKGVLDEQIATAFLTGIVAATDRFSNNLTSSKVMTVAAQLMSAGANQQLIASQLESANEITPPAAPPAAASNSDGTTDLAEGESTKLTREKPAPKPPKKPKPAQKPADGELVVPHEKRGDLEEVREATEAEERKAAAERVEAELAKQSQRVPRQRQASAAEAAEEKLAQQLGTVAPAAAAAAKPSLADIQRDIAHANAEAEQAAAQPVSAPVAPPPMAEPRFGGTLNATTEQAAEDKKRELANDQNRTILTHGNNTYVGNSQPTFQSPLNGAGQPEYEASVDPLSQPQAAPAPQEPAVSYAPPIQPPNETLADLDAKTRHAAPPPPEEARAAVDAAFNATPPASPFGPAPAPAAPAPVESPFAAPGLPPLPPMPDFSTLPPLPPAPSPASAPAAQPTGALPPEKLEEMFGPAQAPPAAAPQPTDPGQFRIPGQS